EVINSRLFEQTNFALVANFGLEIETSKVEFSLEYNARELGEEQVKAIGGYYEKVLRMMASEPTGRYEEARLLSAEEYHQELVEWNETAVEYPTDKCIHQLFEEQVERTPDAVAVAYEEQSLTYRELNSRANQLAHHLRAMGVGPEELVGICLERSIEMVVGLLGVLKAGGAYLPLDPAYPKERLAFILEDADVPIILTQQRLTPRLPHRNARVVCLDTDLPIIARHSGQNTTCVTSAEQVAYLLYTSGSTGQPKGVLGVHRATLNALNWMWSTYPFSPQEICCHKTSISFGDAISELLGPLLSGISTVLIPENV